MVIICPTLCISGCVQGSSELSYRQVAARDYRVPEGIDRHSVNDDAAIPTRFDRKNFLQLSLKMAYTVLSHLGALRLPDHSILFPATPESAEEIPFDPIWLTTASLIGATNILAAPVSVLRTSSFLTTCHRQARARPRFLPGY